jgi:hypothetical protein
LFLAVPARIDSKCAFPSYLSAIDRNKVDAIRLRAVDAEVIDLVEVIALQDLRIGVVRVRAASPEADGSRLESSSLALDSSEPASFVDNEVSPSVLSVRDEDCVAGVVQRKHDREL